MVTCESVAGVTVTAKRPARFNFLSREASAAVVATPHESSTETRAEATSGVKSERLGRCANSGADEPRTPELALPLKWQEERKRLEEGLKKLELESEAWTAA